MRHEQQVRGIARALSEIAQALEGADDVQTRVQRSLELIRDLVPYERCALWIELSGREPQLFVAPPAGEDARARLRRVFHRLLALVGDADDIGPSSDAATGMNYLTVPLVGLDDVIGLLRVESTAETQYDGTHLRLLSVVGAQIAAYVTMLKLRQAEEARSRELAAERDFQRVLIGAVSHDLRNPLAVITMVATRALEAPESEAQARAMTRALRSAQRATRIINDLLDVTRTRVTGALHIERAPADLRVVLERTVDDVRLAHPGRELQLVVEGGADLTGAWDADRLAQLAVNLINNALQHGTPSRAVRVTVGGSDDEVCFSVHNHGAPIRADVIPLLFDPFVQGGRQQRKRGGGLGLGLYIVDQIARAHGGAVTVASSDAGTTFTVRLPRRAAVQGPSAPRPSDAPLRVLVVDDDEDIREGTKDLLEHSGYLVDTAADGQEALSLLRGGLRPSLILLDLAMPVMDGEAFVAECKQDDALKEIPVLILTGETATALRLTRGGAAGAFLQKPFEPKRLVEAIDRLSSADRAT